MPNEDTAGVGGAPARESGLNPARRGSVFALNNWRLRSKLALILIIPTLTALVLGALRVVDDAQQAVQFGHTADQVAFAGKVTTVIHDLQGERSLAVARLSSGDSLRQTGLDAQIAKVDHDVEDLRNSLVTLNPDDQATSDRYARGIQRLDALRPLRAAVGSSAYSDVAVLDTYSSILNSLIQLGREVTTAVTDRDLLRLGNSTQAISEAKEFTLRGDTALEIAAFRDGFPGDLLDQTRAAEASGDASIAAFLANATDDQVQLYSDTVSGPEVDDRRRIQTQAFSFAQQGEGLNIDPTRLGQDSTVASDKMRAVETNLLTQLRTQADDLASSAVRSAWVGGVIVLAALIAALILMLVIARLMLRPLRVLRTTALDVAYTRLPETVQSILDDPDPVNASKKAVDPVPVTSRDEIGEVARSFDVVHGQAVKMAAEQALLRENVNGIFVNLSRRSQRLVERQLGVIDRLEADEQDPDHLASLFELDHLATRLRRNGESLLVLSGAGLAKSVPKPVPAADVIGAAVSEIEQYARIEVGIVPEVAVQGLAIHDLVHVLAELLDNATYFSEPETKVTVRAVVTRKKALAIQITDHGVGMTEDRLAEVNQRLADPPDLDVSVTRRMGLYVVARLAQRHGIEVRLRENEDIEGGVIARVVVPAELLTQLRVANPMPRHTPPPMNRNEVSHPSLPPMNRQFEQFDSTPPPMSAPPAAPPAPVVPAQSNGGLVPLDQPISLDDLVAGNRAAGPFLSPESALPEGPAWPTAEDLAPLTQQSNGDGASLAETQFPPLVLPKREPKYVAPEEPQRQEPAADDGASALEDDVPTRRLPIYQSVLSRWFSEGEDGEPAGADDLGGLPAEPAAPEAVEASANGASAPESRVVDEPVADEPAGIDEAFESRQEEPIEATPLYPGSDDGWSSASDEGWQAAQSLLEKKSEEITQAGLPKRVPNAYLVPGSIGDSAQDDGHNSFTDATAGLPGTGAITRSAAAARNRMASFQRGYTSGRHSLKERPADETRLDDEGVRVTGSGYVSDSSEERQ
ncbi:nitrate- and nitrite sensing domain-containing protein [Amycolatopsis rhabdoformis]|uniref:histidine kinase n=1 Tax=Amycolatopsis rhabdoformis TaxID=1448059 RepID=A0ABZ1HZJ3_9PSEU|nr:nitrate- and nitrite sensing domain-containing protein [Amycolatopsis rhabdoformis]WSE27553.1 nitrate- and nitrite sensing domain-containing protein [Amycolatopsis rhabdoformis]